MLLHSELPLNFSRLADEAKGNEELLARGSFRCFSDKHSASTDFAVAGADLCRKSVISEVVQSQRRPLLGPSPG